MCVLDVADFEMGALLIYGKGGGGGGQTLNLLISFERSRGGGGTTSYIQSLLRHVKGSQPWISVRCVFSPPIIFAHLCTNALTPRIARQPLAKHVFLEDGYRHLFIPAPPETQRIATNVTTGII